MTQVKSRWNCKYRIDISWYKDDNGERTEPGVSNGEEDIARHLRAGEVPQRQNHHA